MLVIWQGKGLFGLIPLVGIPTLTIVSALMLFEYQPKIARIVPLFTDRVAAGVMVAAILGGWFGGGLICFLLGRRWNQDENYHHVYFVPVQYLGLASCLACVAAILFAISSLFA